MKAGGRTIWGDERTSKEARRGGEEAVEGGRDGKNTDEDIFV